MDKDKVAEFVVHYQNLDEWELARLHDNSALTEEARAALDAVVSNRGIDLESCAKSQPQKSWSEKKLNKLKPNKRKRGMLASSRYFSSSVYR
ncbi:MAG: hypothetical protein ABI612_19610 [Betaproteobacteria bacterium]